jgi:hypothetical protein
MKKKKKSQNNLNKPTAASIMRSKQVPSLVDNISNDEMKDEYLNKEFDSKKGSANKISKKNKNKNNNTVINDNNIEQKYENEDDLEDWLKMQLELLKKKKEKPNIDVQVQEATYAMSHAILNKNDNTLNDTR